MGLEFALARPVLVIHALLGFVVLTASIHVVVDALRSGPRPSAVRTRVGTLSRVVFWVLLGTVITGALIYPVFRVTVRGPVFDVQFPALTFLFEVKEWAGVLALLAAWPVWRYFRCPADGADRLGFRSHLLLALIVALIALHNVIAGLVMVMVRSV